MKADSQSIAELEFMDGLNNGTTYGKPLGIFDCIKEGTTDSSELGFVDGLNNRTTDGKPL